jgi:hypothetical protein
MPQRVGGFLTPLGLHAVRASEPHPGDAAGERAEFSWQKCYPTTNKEIYIHNIYIYLTSQ